MTTTPSASRAVALAALALVCVAESGWAQRRPRVSEVQLAPADARLRVGEKAPFLATAYDAAGNPLDSVSFAWSSSNPDVASIDAGGIATGVSPGLAIITVRAGTGDEAKSAQAPVQVAAAAAPTAQPSPAAPIVVQQRAAPSAPNVARVTLLPADASLRVGEQRPFLATALDPSGNQWNSATFQWSSSNAAVASVDQRGVVTGVSPGLAVITARTGAGEAAKSADAPVQVGAATAPAPAGPASAPSAAPAVNRLDSLRRACDGGDFAGCNGLGNLYSHGAGVAVDLDQARTLFQRACDGGNALGCFNLGVTYEAGRGVSRDFAQAAAYFRRACEGGNAIGNARGCTRLAELYDSGRGVRRDRDQARAYFQRGCNGGDLLACTRLQRSR